MHFTGKIRYTLKNDYMFKAVFQQNEDVLKGFLASLLNLPVSHIRNVHIENPMILGKNIYGSARQVIHIAIIDFQLFDGESQFYSQNRFMDKKTHRIYSDNFV